MLATLEDLGPASQAEPSSRTGIYRSDLVAVTSELAARGLVDRQPDPADRRRKMVTLTGPGRRQPSRVDELPADVEDEVPAPLTRRQRAALTRLLATLVDHNGGQM